jgi:hypothetical protein
MHSRRFLGSVGLLAVAAAAAAQDEKKAPPAPADVIPSPFRAFLVVDDRFPPKVNPVTKPDDRDPKDRTGKMHCLVGEFGLSPTVAVFVRAPLAADMGGARQLVVGPDGGLARLVKAIDGLVPKYRGERLGGFVQFLQLEGGTKLAKVTAPDGTVTAVELDKEYPDDEKRDVYAKDVKDFANAVKAPNLPFGLAPVTSRAVTAWNIKPEDEVTVVIYDRMRVAKRWVFKADAIGDAQVQEVLAATEAMIKK